MEENRILKTIKSPDDVKKLPPSCLDELTDEIRREIIEITAKNGGHLASNLGIVELTLAIHRVFDLEAGDRLLFDVGHQSYTHKLLTGRGEKFSTVRQYGGISGLTNKNESKFDTVTSGHSGTSLSAAIGLAEANKINGSKSWVVCVIGDGSFTNGMIYEALNQLAGENLRLVIVLNDNGMSISKNVGGFSRYLSYIRTSEGYFNLKIVLKKVFSRIPAIGKHLISGTRRLKDGLKRLFSAETWFESFGLDYIGPVNGNELERITAVLGEAKQRCAPVIVHAKTKKGLGFSPAEEMPEKYHSVSGGSSVGVHGGKSAEKCTYTEVFSDLLGKTARERDKICAITAAMTDGCGLRAFAGEFPERFFDVGIAEEHAVTMAAGLSIGGMIPVTVMYSTFAQRVYDQLWHDVSLQDLSMILMLSHCGLVTGDGETHQGIFDVPLFSSIPNVSIYSPYDEESMRDVWENVVNDEKNGIRIVRYPKAKCADITLEGARYHAHGGLSVWDYGQICDLTVVTYGRITETVLRAAEKSLAEGRGVRVISMRKIFPIPEELFGYLGENAAVIEEGLKIGGIGEKIAARISLFGLKTRLRIKAIEDSRIPQGDLSSLMRHVGLDFDSIVEFMK